MEEILEKKGKNIDECNYTKASLLAQDLLGKMYKVKKLKKYSLTGALAPTGDGTPKKAIPVAKLKAIVGKN